MKIVIIHGQSHKGSTYHLARNLAEKIGGDIKEFFLPKDFDEFCIGCTTCFVKGEEQCPHHAKLLPITDALDMADVIILASPVYVFHVTGAMKALLDHYGFRWMAHRPEEKMCKKQGVCISTAEVAGTKSTNQDMAHSLFNWGVPRIYKLGFAVAATSYDGISVKKKQAIEKKTEKLANKIKKASQKKLNPSLKLRGMFAIMRLVQINGWNPKDMDYWNEKGWTKDKRPWRG